MYENSQYVLVAISTWLVICVNKYIFTLMEILPTGRNRNQLKLA